MLDERSKYFEYLRKQPRVRRSRLSAYVRRAVIFAAVQGILNALIEAALWAVRDSWLGIPQPVQKYMLDYGIWRFSYDAFRALAQDCGLTQPQVLLLGSVYYGYWVLWALMLAVSVGFIVNEARLLFNDAWRRRERRSHHRNRRAFWRVMSLHSCLDQLSYQPRRSERRRAIGLIKSIHPYKIVSPLREGWQADPAHRWFQQNQLTKQTIRTLAALKAFRKKALYCVRNDQNVARLAAAVSELGTFLYVASLDGETEYRLPKRTPGAREAGVALARFADTLNQIQVKREAKPTLSRRMVDGVSSMCASRSVRPIIAIAVSSAAIIGVGSLLFKVPASTAFLTWVSTVFGSALLGIALTVPGPDKAPE